MVESLSPLSERDEYERAVLARVAQMPTNTHEARLARLVMWLRAMWQYDSLPHG